MKLVNLVGDRFKERPSDCVVDSHALMIKGGYMKNVANGIFSLYPSLKRITRKIENIIREEMDAIEGQEVLFPVVLPGSLWEESGRYQSVGSELLRFTDRGNTPMLLGMTHEEAAVHLVREYGNSYTRYPFMIYQIQTKFRDEARPRAGLIRVREFTMKDAYSFHTSQEDLEAYYDRCLDAYNRIFKRAGIPEVITVASDTGMMGGKVAHEFMLPTPIGEDYLAICDACDFSANMEAAETVIKNQAGNIEPLIKVHTPNAKTIEEVMTFLGTDIKQACKAVVYQKNEDNSYVVVFTRGDMDINDVKLKNHLGAEVYPAAIEESSDIVAGFIGPKGITDKATVLFDRSLEGINSLIVGANEKDHHCTGFNFERDYGPVTFVDLSKIQEGGICPKCGDYAIKLSRGIEVGNIFQLGVKYSKAMSMTYQDENGEAQHPIMGCYGIGVGRLAASVCEARHDDFGPIWPITIAPWQVHLCCLRVDDEETKAFADKLYLDLQKQNVEVIYDDRDVRPGFMFSDADLLGVPVRAVVSPRNLKESVVEITTRDKRISKKVSTDEVVSEIKSIINDLFAEINS